jgi:hypothetical protein
MDNKFHYSIDVNKYINKFKTFCLHFGLNINFDNPKTIQDKLAWLNFYDEDPLKVKCADKLLVREYCKDVLGVDLCVPVIAVYNNIDDIDWNSLPDRFVMKCNHGSGMNIIVKDKSKLNIDDAKKKLNNWMNMDFSMLNGFESHYHDIVRKIFVEKYMEVNGDVPYDYKFSCFNGEPKFVQVFGERYNSGKHMNYYDMDFNYINMARTDFKNRPDIKHKKPDKFELMKEYARKLSEHFKYVRVDFYEIDNQIYLGELTFTPGACIFRYVNKEDEIKVGNMLRL